MCINFLGASKKTNKFYAFKQDYAYRINVTDQNGLPKIVAQVIGYGLAAELFNLMDLSGNDTNGTSEKIPDEWKGELINVTYAFGGKLKENRLFQLICNCFQV